ncbi:tellurite resistance TerB family protein [Pelistega sp. MC2]|nr:tellurite resistance TerB family protein [Pelistega sp. MC2]
MMSAFNILEQLFGKGAGNILDGLQQQARDTYEQARQSESLNKIQSQGTDIFNQIKDATTGDKSVLTDGDKTSLAAGALAVLLGQKTDSNLAKIGGLAALGTVAFKAFQRWQAQQAQSSSSDIFAQGGSIPASNPVTESDSIASTENNTAVAPVVEQASRALIIAMISAAKADGHIQEDEKAQLDGHLAQLSNPQDRAWFQAELDRPVDPAYVASYATDPHLAAQIYAMSLAMCNQQNFMEKAYLDELARQLNLDASLKAELEAQVKNI